MILTITLPPENGNFLQEQAQALGLPLTDYVTQIITEKAALPPEAVSPETMPFEEWDALLRSGTINAPPMRSNCLLGVYLMLSRHNIAFVLKCAIALALSGIRYSVE